MKRNTLPLAALLGLWVVFGLIGQAAVPAGAAEAARVETHAVLLLYPEARAGGLKAQVPRLIEQGCKPWRGGPVAGANGSLEIGSPERFVLFACSAEILGDPGRRVDFEALIRPGSGVRAVEGRILLRDEAQPAPAVQRRRAYILKISHYNNSDPDGRDRDLEQINALAGDRADAWTTEGFIAVRHAFGMPTPDEVVVIHYDDPDQGRRFRNSNPDVLDRIGAFNERHLTEFTYLSAMTER